MDIVTLALAAKIAANKAASQLTGTDYSAIMRQVEAVLNQEDVVRVKDGNTYDDEVTLVQASDMEEVYERLDKVEKDLQYKTTNPYVFNDGKTVLTDSAAGLVQNLKIYGNQNGVSSITIKTYGGKNIFDESLSVPGNINSITVGSTTSIVNRGTGTKVFIKQVSAGDKYGFSLQAKPGVTSYSLNILVVDSETLVVKQRILATMFDGQSGQRNRQIINCNYTGQLWISYPQQNVQYLQLQAGSKVTDYEPVNIVTWSYILPITMHEGEYFNGTAVVCDDHIMPIEDEEPNQISTVYPETNMIITDQNGDPVRAEFYYKMSLASYIKRVANIETDSRNVVQDIISQQDSLNEAVNYALVDSAYAAALAQILLM